MKQIIKKILREQVQSPDYLEKVSMRLDEPYFKNMEEHYGITNSEDQLEVMKHIYGNDIRINDRIKNKTYINDSNGFIIYSEDSVGYWEKYKFKYKFDLTYNPDHEDYVDHEDYEDENYESKNKSNRLGYYYYYEDSDGKKREWFREINDAEDLPEKFSLIINKNNLKKFFYTRDDIKILLTLLNRDFDKFLELKLFDENEDWESLLQYFCNDETKKLIRSIILNQIENDEDDIKLVTNFHNKDLENLIRKFDKNKKITNTITQVYNYLGNYIYFNELYDQFLTSLKFYGNYDINNDGEIKINGKLSDYVDMDDELIDIFNEVFVNKENVGDVFLYLLNEEIIDKPMFNVGDYEDDIYSIIESDFDMETYNNLLQETLENLFLK